LLQWEAELADPFSFPVWQEELVARGVRELHLSNTDIQHLQSLAQPGGILDRMQRFFLDHSKVLAESVFEIDISTDAGRTDFIRAQAQYQAILIQKAWLEQTLTLANPESTAEQEISK